METTELQSRSIPEGSIQFTIRLHKYALTEFGIQMATGTASIQMKNFRDLKGSTLDSSCVHPRGASFVNNTTTTNVDGNGDPVMSSLSFQANESCEFELEVTNKANISKLLTPSFFSIWELSVLSGCNALSELHIRGRVSGSFQPLQTMTSLTLLRIEAVLDTIDMSYLSTSPLHTFYFYPRPFDYPMGKSVSFSSLDVKNYINNSTLKVFKIFTTEKAPQRMITGYLDHFKVFNSMSETGGELYIRFTSMSPVSKSSLQLNNGLNVNTLIYNNNAPSPS